MAPKKTLTQADAATVTEPTAPKPKRAPRTKAAKPVVAAAPVVEDTVQAAEPTAVSPGLVQEQAYFLWLEEGQPSGREVEHWLQAEQVVLAKLRNVASLQPAF